jgi:50S ribosomal protein L16 3-hydroxylase
MIRIKISLQHRVIFCIESCMNLNLFNDDITETEFTSKYWNKKHYVFKNAVQDIFALDQETIFELMMAEDIESRAIINNKQRKLYHGPFDQDQIKKFIAGDYNFIIHDLNTLFAPIENLQLFMNKYSNWEFDDVICTYSNKGMSLGAHYDPYNVFILQAEGKRKWQLQYDPNNIWNENEEIKVLDEFYPEIEIDLNPGDILYIPPKVAHNGISLTKSLSYSIGFKALRFKSLLEQFLIKEISNIDEDLTYSSKWQGSNYPKDLTIFFKEEFSKIIDENKIERFLKHYISLPKQQEDFTEEIDHNFYYQKDAYVKWVIDRKSSEIYINGAKYSYTNEDLIILETYLNKSSFETFKFKENDLKSNTLKSLIKTGVFFRTDLPN